MKTIRDVMIENKQLVIKDVDFFYRFENTENHIFGNLKVYKYDYEKDKSNFKYYKSYSKDELIKFQNILLKAYVYSNDELEDAVANSESKDLLDKIKRNIILTRKQLKNIVKYISYYDELLENYKDV